MCGGYPCIPYNTAVFVLTIQYLELRGMFWDMDCTNVKIFKLDDRHVFFKFTFETLYEDCKIRIGTVSK
jgi:hypothetical protein